MRILFPWLFVIFLMLFLSFTSGCSGDEPGADAQTVSQQKNSGKPLSKAEMAKMVELLDQVEKLDKLDLQQALDDLDQCLRNDDVKGAEKHAKYAQMYISDAGDKQLIKKAETRISGVRALLKAKGCIKKESFSCARENIQEARQALADSSLLTMLDSVQGSYNSTHSKYKARQRQAERQREAERQRQRNSYSSKKRCRNPELGNWDGRSYFIYCDPASVLGTVYRSGSRWDYKCNRGKSNYSYYDSSHTAMWAAVDDCEL